MWINRRAELVDETSFDIEFDDGFSLKMHITCDLSAILTTIVATDDKILYYYIIMMGNTTISTEITA